MDVLDEILSSLRLTGGVVDRRRVQRRLLRATRNSRRAISRRSSRLPDKLISYHYVRSGQLIVEVDGHAAGDSRARATSRSCRATTRTCWRAGPGCARPMPSEISWVTADGVHRVTTGTDGPKAEVWCGFLGDGEETASIRCSTPCRRC